METYTITNRSGLKVHIQIDISKNSDKLVFIAHGQRGSLSQDHIQAFADAFLQNNYRVVRFDATHALGKSDGDLETVTYDSYVSDLEDVIEWAKTQEWFKTQFALCGHSMGAQSTAWYAENHPQDISLLLPMAPTINFDLWSNVHDANELKAWKSAGYKDFVSRSTGRTVRVGWQVNESLKKFNILEGVKHLTMPILNIIGEFDEPCPEQNQKIFMAAIASSDKTLHVLSGLEHSYRDFSSGRYAEGPSRVRTLIDDWLRAHS